MGYTLMHEHTIIDLSGIKEDDDCRLDCMTETIEEYKRLRMLGVSTIVDVTNVGMGRNSSRVCRIAEESGMEIIQSTGFYKEPFLPEWFYEKSVQELAEYMISELEDGIQDEDGSGPRAGMIGEIGTGKNGMSPAERKIFDSAVLAARHTGAPIYTHTTLGTYAVEQASFFATSGLDLSRIVIGHMDLSGDLTVIRSVLDTGINVGFDTVGKNNYFPDSGRVVFLRELEKDGLLDQVVLSMDLTRKSHLKNHGGIGYEYLPEIFLPMLRHEGVSEESIEKMLIHNPKRILKVS